MNAFPHQQRADRSLRPGARTLRQVKKFWAPGAR
jgi:hypothetical protein